MTLLEFYHQSITLCATYIIGSIPFGLLVCWMFNLSDPRTTGSKNIGATNIYRIGSKGAAALTLFLDLLKGIAAVLFTLIYYPSFVHIAVISAVIGHIWPIWLWFRGGKGVATALGGILILSWPLAVVSLISWITIAATTRYASLASIITVILSPLYTAFLSGGKFVVLCIILALLITWSHRSNIVRLITGKEPKIGTDDD